MKHLTFILAFILFTQTSLAQETEIKNHNFVIGGSMSFSINNSEQLATPVPIGQISYSNERKYKNTRFSFSPYIAKSLNEHWLLGLQLNNSINISKTKSTVNQLQGSLPLVEVVNGTRKTTILGGGLFARYIINPSNKFNFYLQPTVLFRDIVEKQETAPQESPSPIQSYSSSSRNYSFNISLNAGLMYHLNSKWRLITRTGLVNYSIGKRSSNDADIGTYNNFSTNINLSSIYFGLEYKF